MTQKEFADYIRLETRTDSTSLPDATILIWANAYLPTLSSKLNELDEDILGVDATAPLESIASVASGSNREYPMPSDVLGRIKMVEAKLDGTNWVRLEELDLNTYDRTTDESTIISQFANYQGKAFYDIWRGSLWIYSGTLDDVTAGLHLWYLGKIAKLDDLTENTRDMSVPPTTSGSTSYEHGCPEEVHEMFATHVIIRYKNSLDIPMPLTEREQNFEAHLYDAMKRIKKGNMDRKTYMKPPSMETNGTYGYDY